MSKVNKVDTKVLKQLYNFLDVLQFLSPNDVALWCRGPDEETKTYIKLFKFTNIKQNFQKFLALTDL